MEKQLVLIAGLGLIGGSIAKAIKKQSEHYIIGFDIQKNTLGFALDHNIIDEASTNFEEAALQADIIIISAPISETIQLIAKLDGLAFTKDVIVSDTASVKSSILIAAKELTNQSIRFIGGHPMAGSHKKGIEAAKEHLFENAIYVLSPLDNATEENVNTLRGVLASTKSNFVVLQSEEHDEMTGVISHFPHLIASSLVHQARKWEKKHAFLPKLAAGGFRDITRIASSNPVMWQDIFYHNQSKMSAMLEDWIIEMEHLKKMIEENEKEEVITYLDSAKNYRDGLNEGERGAIPAFYDVYVDIADQPGAIAEVALILANASLSIKNIEILEVREGITGALRLSFYTKEEQEAGQKVLRQRGFETTMEV
ncbi:prephenate dehydrogenase [Oceanobacillus sp. J11TS1]|uniref:prephenate dehydrogenase n=1 Tax=Oceanobacillus sp. J11TS1 TaxID=2807191 RepID=UPI001B299F16|nr:prephenate dehydrogenase [Oceanobacillus sp. J11TS1]GIO22628.1 prephenate dehydrogenase [Oceanobacillus sp. J11TS1]